MNDLKRVFETPTIEIVLMDSDIQTGGVLLASKFFDPFGDDPYDDPFGTL